MLAERQAQSAEALRHYEAAIEILEKTRSSLEGADFKLPFLTRRILLYQRYVSALLKRGEIERALAVADSSRAQVLAESLGQRPRARPSARRFP